MSVSRYTSTPGQYFRRCRERADFTTLELSQRLGTGAGRYPRAESQILLLEADTPGEYAQLAYAVARRRLLPGFSLSHFLNLCAATCTAKAIAGRRAA
jgi:hypothetical protein